jgi:hypothetical protein
MRKDLSRALLALAVLAPATVLAQDLPDAAVIIRESPALEAGLRAAPYTAWGGFVDRKETYRVMGLTEREALARSGDPDGDVFSAKHAQGDIANRWTHAAVVKSASAAFAEAGFGKLASALLGAAIMLPKEYLIDRRPSASDLVIADYALFQSGNRQRGESRMFLSVFGDGALFLSYEKSF